MLSCGNMMSCPGHAIISLERACAAVATASLHGCSQAAVLHGHAAQPRTPHPALSPTLTAGRPAFPAASFATPPT